MRSFILRSWVFAAVASAALAISCGAEDKVAPAAIATSASSVQCKDFAQLMPAFEHAISTGQTENLKIVVENQLLKPLREGGVAPINDVMRSIFQTLTRLASAAPEPGAPTGQTCAADTSPPPLSQANDICEIRRALDSLVHEGKGIEAVNLVSPQLQILLNYIAGRGNDCQGKPRTAHYEVAAVFSSLCTQDANCQLSNGLDLLVAFSDYANTPAGKKLANDLNALAAQDAILNLLDPSQLTEDDTVAIIKALIPAIEGADSTSLHNAFNQLPLSQPVLTALQPMVDDLADVLSHPELITPIRRAITCVTGKDTNYEAVRMAYRIAIGEKCEAFGLTRLTAALKGLEDVDQRGSLIFVAGQLGRAIRSDEEAVDSAAVVCRTIFSTAPEAGQARPNAQMVIPVAAQLVEAGVVSEGICAADTLLFGCAGGKQPACPAP
jgi:hypothetical protein